MTFFDPLGYVLYQSFEAEKIQIYICFNLLTGVVKSIFHSYFYSEVVYGRLGQLSQLSDGIFTGRESVFFHIVENLGKKLGQRRIFDSIKKFTSRLSLHFPCSIFSRHM